MSTIADVRDALVEVGVNAWQASSATSSYPLFYDDVQKTHVQATDDDFAWGRISVRHTSSEVECLGGPGIRKYKNLGVVTVECISRAGYGMSTVDAMAQPIKQAYRQAQPTGIRLYDVGAFESPFSGGQVSIQVRATFEWEESF